MFDLCYSTGANLQISNRLGLTPLMLAAKLQRVDVSLHQVALNLELIDLDQTTDMQIEQMFFHILAIQRQVNWIFCNVGFAEIPLDGIDSVDPITGACKNNAVLPLVVSGVSTFIAVEN